MGTYSRSGQGSFWPLVVILSAVTLFIVGGVVATAVAHHGTGRQCVSAKSMKVAAPDHCQSPDGSPDGSPGGYRWYYGSAVTQVGSTARGGSFTDPDENQGKTSQNGGGDDENGGSGGDDDTGGSGGGADDG
jgi:hypothetical protein